MGKGFPPAGVGWYAVILLACCYAVSYIDRWILSLLIEPIKADLGLSDFQISLLLGPAFAIFYATMGIPIAWLADRKNRRNIIAIGITLWSLATAAAGLARSFADLFITRVLVGVGETALGPSAISMISDMFPRHRRALAIAIYTSGGTFGSGFGYIIGGQIVGWAKTAQLGALPIVGQVAPWQLVFMIVGLPGLILTLLVLTLREPSRKELAGFQDRRAVSFADTLKYLRNRALVFGGFCAAVSIIAVTAFVQFWNAVLFERTWGWDPTTFSLYNGIGILAVGPAAVYAAGRLAGALTLRGVEDGAYRIVLAGTLLLVPMGALYPLMPNVWGAYVVLQIQTIGVAGSAAVAPTALTMIAPGQIRSQTMALYFMSLSMIGLLLGPTSVAFFTDNVFADEAMIRYSMAIVTLIFGIPSALALIALRRPYGRELRAFMAAADHD